MDVPYSNNVKDFCTVYFKEGTYWNDHITKYFVGDERHCPPIKNVNIKLGTGRGSEFKIDCNLVII